jgi:stage II sporulation protein M
MSFRALFRHFREMRVYFLIVIGLFILGIVLGAYHFQEKWIVEQLKGIQEIAKSVQGKDAKELWLFLAIFKNNVTAMLMMLVMGLFFGIMPLFSILLNGLILGYIGNLSLREAPWFEFAKAIVPHGILEIPALFIAAAYGLKLGALTFRGIGVLAMPDRRATYKSDYARFAKVLVPLVLFLLGLLLLAALIESTLTMWLVTS